MSPYYLLFIVVVLITLTSSIVKEEQAQFFLLMEVIILILFAGLRYHCDSDYKNYIKFYEYTVKAGFIKPKSLIFYKGVEIGFMYICRILNSFNLNYFYLFFIMAFLTIGMINKVFAKLAYTTSIPILLYVSFLYLGLPFTQIRFGLTVSLVFLGIYYLSQGKIIYYFLAITLAALIHFTGLLGFAIILIRNININRNNFILFILLIIAILLTRTDEIFIYAIKNVGMSRYISYVNVNNNINNILSVVEKTILIFPFVYFEEILKSKVKHYRLLLNTALFTILLNSFSWRVEILSRMPVLFMPSIFIIISYYLLIIKNNKRNKLIFLCPLFLYAAYKFSIVLHTLGDYQTIFQR